MHHVRQLLVLTATALIGSTAIAGSAFAQTGPYYGSVPAQAPSRASLMTRETPWTRQGDAYVAARAPERDATLCDAVARSTGALASFTVAGRAYDADALARCNAHAKGGAPAANAVAAR